MKTKKEAQKTLQSLFVIKDKMGKPIDDKSTFEDKVAYFFFKQFLQEKVIAFCQKACLNSKPFLSVMLGQMKHLIAISKISFMKLVPSSWRKI